MTCFFEDVTGIILPRYLRTRFHADDLKPKRVFWTRTRGPQENPYRGFFHDYVAQIEKGALCYDKDVLYFSGSDYLGLKPGVFDVVGEVYQDHQFRFLLAPSILDDLVSERLDIQVEAKKYEHTLRVIEC